VGQGTIFSLFLPLVTPATMADSMPEAAELAAPPVFWVPASSSPAAGVSALALDQLEEEVEAIEQAQTQPPFILVVDDQDEVRAILCLMLERAGYQACDASSAAEALQLLADHPRQFALVLTDYAMPSMTGLALIEAMAGTYPELPCLILTGLQDEDWL